jgi:hypothetical protein
LAWSERPTYEWRFRGKEETHDVLTSEPVSLHNKFTDDYIVYGERSYGIYLRWKKDFTPKESTTKTASLFLSTRMGPWTSPGTNPSTYRVVWTLEPQSLVGGEGRRDKFTIDSDYKGFPRLVGADKYYFFCNEPTVNMASRKWKIIVSTNNWSTEGVVTLHGGNNVALFAEGRAGVRQDFRYPGD